MAMRRIKRRIINWLCDGQHNLRSNNVHNKHHGNISHYSRCKLIPRSQPSIAFISGVFCCSSLLVISFFIGGQLFISQNIPLETSSSPVSSITPHTGSTPSTGYSVYLYSSASTSFLSSFWSKEDWPSLQPKDLNYQESVYQKKSNECYHLNQTELEYYKNEIQKLEKEIEELKKLNSKKKSFTSSSNWSSTPSPCSSIKKIIESFKRFPPVHEVNQFTYFTGTRLFGFGKRVSERQFGSRKNEIKQVMNQIIEINRTHTIKPSNFVDGISATDTILGTEYHLYYKHSPNDYQKISFIRPFGPLVLVGNQILSTTRETIYLILALSESRLNTLKMFIKNLGRLSLRDEIRTGKLKIIISYYGSMDALQKIISKPLINQVIHVSQESKEFSRAEAIQKAALAVCPVKSGMLELGSGNNDCLLFFSDVDIVFTKGFLKRCRLNALKGKKVYYPIVFSLYNPKFSKLNKEVSHFIASGYLQNLINDEHGFWRDFGFGMLCTYKSDFLKIGGFGNPNEERKSPKNVSQVNRDSWGGEDVLLYRKYLGSNGLEMIRSTDPGIIHVWHEKHCNRTSEDQFKSCLSSRASSEGTQTQLALAVYRCQDLN